jgi:predicted nucleic acid-binding Zn ribbon protein
MPTYVYKFIDSGETIEVQQSFDDSTLTEYTHPVSGRLEAVKKVFLPVGVTFKGNGFYKTDSRNGSPGRGPSRDSSSKEPSTGNGDSASSTEKASSSDSSSKDTSSKESSTSSGSTSSGSTSSGSGSASTSTSNTSS